MDLHRFATELASATDRARIHRACHDVCAIIDGDGGRSPIIAAGHLGAAMAPARGTSSCLRREASSVRIRPVHLPVDGAGASRLACH